MSLSAKERVQIVDMYNNGYSASVLCVTHSVAKSTLFSITMSGPIRLWGIRRQIDLKSGIKRKMRRKLVEPGVRNSCFVIYHCKF